MISSLKNFRNIPILLNLSLLCMAWPLHVAKSNAGMIQHLFEDGMIKSKPVIDAMNSVDRANYAPYAPYEDRPQSIGFDATISAPHMHATALEFLMPSIMKENAKILDIGCGSGYLSAVMARMNPTSKVFGIDYLSGLVELAIANVEKSDGDLLKNGRLKLVQGDGWEGLKDESPFDCIHVGAAAAYIPKATITQLRLGGLMIIPVGPEQGAQDLLLINRTGDSGEVKRDYSVRNLMSVVYVPLVQKE